VARLAWNAPVTPAGAVEIAVVWAFWLLVLLIPAVSVGMSVVGLGVFGPIAIVYRVRSRQWPPWGLRVFACSTVAAAVAVPSVLLLVRTATQ
jgi:hypothetical protein